MNVLSSLHVANSFLVKSFNERKYITPLKLNCLVYLLYSDFLYETGEKLFSELFEKTERGPVLPSVDFKFGCLGNNVITKYAKDATGRVFVIEGDHFEETLDYIWNGYKNMSDTEVLEIVNSGYEYSKKEENETLSDEEILSDEIKINEEKLENAKSYIKKFKRNV